jgi:hypothetical protein
MPDLPLVHRPVADRLVRTVALGMLAGMAFSLALWWGPRDYPRAPLVALASAQVPAIERTLAGLLAAALLALVWRPSQRAFATLACLALVGCWLLDQSRLQPWAFLYGLILLRAATLSPRPLSIDARLADHVRVLLACSYFWSGLQKLHVLFGPVSLGSLVEPLLPDYAELPAPARIALGLVLAASESLIGVAFLFQRTRRIAALAVIAMHALLLLVLAVGLRWNPVVWPWNVAMAVLAWCVRAPTAGEVPGGYARLLWGRDLVARALLVLLGLLPALSFVDRWDAYPSLALYSPRIEGARICFGEGVKGRLPPELQALLVTRAPHSYELWIEDWSQADLNVPAYPSERVLRAVAREFLAGLGNPPQARVVVHGRPGPISGNAAQRVYTPDDV